MSTLSPDLLVSAPPTYLRTLSRGLLILLICTFLTVVVTLGQRFAPALFQRVAPHAPYSAMKVLFVFFQITNFLLAAVALVGTWLLTAPRLPAPPHPPVGRWATRIANLLMVMPMALSLCLMLAAMTSEWLAPRFNLRLSQSIPGGLGEVYVVLSELLQIAALATLWYYLAQLAHRVPSLPAALQCYLIAAARCLLIVVGLAIYGFLTWYRRTNSIADYLEFYQTLSYIYTALAILTALVLLWSAAVLAVLLHRVGCLRRGIGDGAFPVAPQSVQA